MMLIEKQREEYYKQLGTPPGVPTMKGATADPNNTGIGYNSIITNLGDHSVPEGWIQHPKFNGKGDVPGPPIQWSEPESPDNALPGYGYIPADTTDTEDIFFYHSDHLGSTSYITDAKANITQFDAYLPYGELLVDEHSSSEELPYKFNGKEMDEETGLYYYGARYLNPVTSLWYGVDPLVEKFASASGYVYTLDNPVKMVDQDGKFPHYWQAWIARKFYNLFHHIDASPIQENLEAKNPRLRYTYNTVTTDEYGEIVFTNVSRAKVDLFSKAQKAGTTMAIGGYALTLSGVGAEIGAPIATIGNTINGFGTAGQLGLDIVNGDFDISDGVSIAFSIGDFFIDKMINKVIPGVEAPSMKDIVKALYNGLLKKGKLNLRKDFDLGKEILKQGASLKLQGLEMVTDKAIDHEKESHENNPPKEVDSNNN